MMIGVENLNADVYWVVISGVGGMILCVDVQQITRQPAVSECA